MKDNYTITITTDHKAAADKIMELFATYRTQFTNFVLGGLRQENVEADPYFTISKNDYVITVQTVAIDKGKVWAKTGEDVTFADYLELPEDTPYVILERGALTYYLKQDEQTADKLLGTFHTTTDMYEELLNQELLEEAISYSDQNKKAQQEQEARVVKMN